MKSLLYLLLIVWAATMLQAQSPALPAVPKEKEIILPVTGGSLVGTLAIPKRFKQGPVVLLIAGSGPTDRNGNNPLGGKNNSLQYLAHHLAEAGIASLRYDKRMIGASKFPGLQEGDLRFEDYVQDAVAWIDYLRQDKRYAKLIVAGHSEGALIGMLAAVGKADAFVSIAGAGKPAVDLLKDQLKAQNMQPLEVLYAKLDSITAGQRVHVMTATDMMLFRPSVQPYMQSWLRYDPRVEIAKLDMPVLLVQGTRDIQVPESDAQALMAAHPRARLAIVVGMNHVFRLVDSEDPAANWATYSDIHLPIASELVTAVVEFVQVLQK
jgi:hypothetical protein